MATTKSTQIAADAKRRKQLIILGVAGALLAVLAVIQLPKLLGGSEEPTPAAVSEATTTPAPGTTGVTPAAAPVRGGAVLAGVSLPPLRLSPVDEGELGAFNLLRPKDPFVQLVTKTGIQSSGGGEAAAIAARVEAEQSRQRAAEARRRAARTNVAKPEGRRQFATIAVNDKLAQMRVREAFPKATKHYVLQALAPTTATVLIAGGPFPKGQTVKLTLGKTVTLVNSKTGQRATLRLLYTGDQPEEITTLKPGS